MSEPLQPDRHLVPLLAASRLGVVTDCDGTISPLAIRPEAAVVSPVARAALATLAERLPLVAAMSGRALFDLRALVDLPQLLYIGSHGLTWWYRGVDEMPDDVLPYVEYARLALAELAALRAEPGVRFEAKGVGLALHYRQAANPDAARAHILEAISGSPAAQRFEVRQGILVVELFPRLVINKGTALRRLVQRFNLDAILFFGDDLTDVDAMYATTALKAEHTMQAISVAARHAEAPLLAAEVADYTVDGVAGVEAALEWLVTAGVGVA